MTTKTMKAALPQTVHEFETVMAETRKLAALQELEQQKRSQLEDLVARREDHPLTRLALDPERYRESLEADSRTAAEVQRHLDILERDIQQQQQQVRRAQTEAQQLLGLELRPGVDAAWLAWLDALEVAFAAEQEYRQTVAGARKRLAGSLGPIHERDLPAMPLQQIRNAVQRARTFR